MACGHDQMEPAGATGSQPSSNLGRWLFNFFLAAFIIFLGFWGVYGVYAGAQSLLISSSYGEIRDSVAVILFALMPCAGLVFLFRPLANVCRAKRLEYVKTNQRALIVRNGPAWEEIWIKSPIIYTVSINFVIGVCWVFFAFFIPPMRTLLTVQEYLLG